ncbi:MAG: GPR endopeptidase [Blautia sp.]
MLGSYKIRTDLALEARESFTEENVEVRGVEVQESYDEETDIRTTVVKITTENGARSMGRPQGNYITIESESLSIADEGYHSEISGEISKHLKRLLNMEKEKSVLWWGWKLEDYSRFSGTWSDQQFAYDQTFDQGIWFEKGWERNLLYEVSGIIPGVMAQTGMETSEIIEGVVAMTKPDVVIAIDALAARSTRRLNRTIQITDTGSIQAPAWEITGSDCPGKSACESHRDRCSHSGRCRHYCP